MKPISSSSKVGSSFATLNSSFSVLVEQTFTNVKNIIYHVMETEQTTRKFGYFPTNQFQHATSVPKVCSTEH